MTRRNDQPAGPEPVEPQPTVSEAAGTRAAGAEAARTEAAGIGAAGAEAAGIGAAGTEAADAEVAGIARADDTPVPGGLGAAVAALTADDIEPAGRRTQLARVVGEARRSGLGQLFRPKAALRWMADTVGEVAPHVPIRDLETLRRHHAGLDDEALAERLIRNAALSTAGVGAAGGGVAAVQWAATPALLSAPVLLAAETVAVVAIELKLLGELHEVYGHPVPGNPAERAVAMVQAWAEQRGVNPLVPGVGVGTVLGTAARKELQGSLLRRFGRNLTTMGPLLTGAAVASYLNRRATRSIGDRVREDLRRRRPIEGRVTAEELPPGHS